jgi:hypothetical protein
MMPPTEVKSLGTSVTRRRAIVAILFCSSLIPSLSRAWTVMLLCPEEFPGPPDCFECQIFGDTSALDDDPYMTWYSAIWGSTYGSFAESDGYNLYFNHYNCPADFSTRWVDIGVHIQIAEIPAENADYTSVVCTGGGGT